MSKAYIYAHLDENGICNGFCGPGKRRTGANLVEVSAMDDYYIRKKYNAETGEWEEVELEETEEPAVPASDPVMEKLESIEAKIQTNEDLQAFYDEIVKEVGL